MIWAQQKRNNKKCYALTFIYIYIYSHIDIDIDMKKKIGYSPFLAKKKDFFV